MTLWLCDRHGPSPIVSLCSHIHDAVTRGGYPEDLIRIELTSEGENLGPSYICRACSSVLGANPAGSYELGTDEGDCIYRLAALAWCEPCFTELRGAK